MSMTHQTAILVYRFTDQHAEECSWKPQMESVKPFFEMVGYYLNANCSSAYYYGSIAAHYQLGAAGNGLCGLGDGDIKRLSSAAWNATPRLRLA